jgi:hypothetical protein
MPHAPFPGGAVGGLGDEASYPAPGRQHGRPDPWEADEDPPAGGDFGDDNGTGGGDFGEADEEGSSDLPAGGDFGDEDDSPAGGDFGDDDPGDGPTGGDF